MSAFSACFRLAVSWASMLLAVWAPSLATASEPRRIPDIAVLAATCANCHGPAGRSPGRIPSLRGLPAEHLLQRMQAFKAGRADDATVMTRLMKGYNDAQLQALARWFAEDQEARR